MDPDHGPNMTADALLSMSPRGMGDEVYDILHGPDDQAPNEPDAAYRPRAQLEARMVRTSEAARQLKTQRLQRVEQQREMDETDMGIDNLERQVVLSLFAPDFPPPDDGNDETVGSTTQVKEEESDRKHEQREHPLPNWKRYNEWRGKVTERTFNEGVTNISGITQGN